MLQIAAEYHRIPKVMGAVTFGFNRQKGGCYFRVAVTFG